MISQMTKSLVAWLIQCDAIDEDDIELYEYAAYSLFITISPIILTIIIGAIMGSLLESIITIIPFMVIRKYSGGYHTKHLHSCLVGSCCLLVLCIGMTSFIKCGMELSIVTLAAIISLIIFSPIDNENRRLEEYEKKKYKKRAGIIAVSFGVIYSLLYLLQKDIYAVCISVGLILSTGLQLPCIVLKKN